MSLDSDDPVRFQQQAREDDLLARGPRANWWAFAKASRGPRMRNSVQLSSLKGQKCSLFGTSVRSRTPALSESALYSAQ